VNELQQIKEKAKILNVPFQPNWNTEMMTVAMKAEGYSPEGELLATPPSSEELIARKDDGLMREVKMLIKDFSDLDRIEDPHSQNMKRRDIIRNMETIS
jgi:hypothetical protein